ncbi:MAG: NAD(P)/FAD-dependent oxidoreductase [Rhizobiaceae bacterium]
MMLNSLHANDRQGEYPRSWYVDTSHPLPLQPALLRHGETEICIIGAGFTGLSAALHLAQADKRVTILEAHRIGWGASGRNGGQVSSGQRRDQADLEAMFGAETSKRLWQLGEEAKRLVSLLITKHAIDCEIRQGIIHADHRPRFVSHSRDHVAKMNDHYGYGAIRFLDQEEVRSLIGSTNYFGGTHDSGAFHIHPLKFLFALARLVTEAGVVIHENSEVCSVEEGDPVILTTTSDKRLRADKIVFACNGYLDRLNTKIASRVMPINNFIIASEPLGKKMARKLISDNSAVSDSRFVINYFRRTSDHRLLFGGGETYGHQFPSDIRGFVRKPMLKIFPQLRDVKIEYGWGGTLAITRNRLPVFARLRSNVWSASGYSGHGISIATLAGKILADAICDKTADFETMSGIAAKRFPGSLMLRKPLLLLAMLWYAMRDRL